MMAVRLFSSIVWHKYLWRVDFNVGDQILDQNFLVLEDVKPYI